MRSTTNPLEHHGNPIDIGQHCKPLEVIWETRGTIYAHGRPMDPPHGPVRLPWDLHRIVWV